MLFNITRRIPRLVDGHRINICELVSGFISTRPRRNFSFNNLVVGIELRQFLNIWNMQRGIVFIDSVDSCKVINIQEIHSLPEEIIVFVLTV